MIAHTCAPVKDIPGYAEARRAAFSPRRRGHIRYELASCTICLLLSHLPEAVKVKKMGQGSPCTRCSKSDARGAVRAAATIARLDEQGDHVSRVCALAFVAHACRTCLPLAILRGPPPHGRQSGRGAAPAGPWPAGRLAQAAAARALGLSRAQEESASLEPFWRRTQYVCSRQADVAGPRGTLFHFESFANVAVKSRDLEAARRACSGGIHEWYDRNFEALRA